MHFNVTQKFDFRSCLSVSGLESEISSRGWNVTYDIKPPISSPPFQAPFNIKLPISSPPYQAPYNIKPLMLNFKSDLTYQAPTYDIKSLVLDVQNEAFTYDIKPFELNRQYGKYETADLPYQAPGATYYIKPFELNRQYETADQPYQTPTYDLRYQAPRIRFSKWSSGLR